VAATISINKHELEDTTANLHLAFCATFNRQFLASIANECHKTDFLIFCFISRCSLNTLNTLNIRHWWVRSQLTMIINTNFTNIIQNKATCIKTNVLSLKW